MAPAVVRIARGGRAGHGSPAERPRRAVSRAPPVAREQKSRLANAHGARARSSSPSSCCRRAGSRPIRSSSAPARLKIDGVDVVNIPDGQRAGARISALSLAVLIEQQAGIETLLHYACRDRNLLGIQSDLLGAHAMGLRNLMLVTGDPGRVGDYPDATAVFDVDSIGLTNVVSRLNHGCDVGGQAIGAPTGVSHRRVGEPGGVESRRRAAAVRVQGRSGRRVRGDAADLRRPRLRGVPQAHRERAAAGRRRRLPVRKRPKRRVHGQRGAGRPGAGGAARADAARRRPGGRRGRRHRDRPRDCQGIARSRCRGSRSRPSPGISTRPWQWSMDFADAPDV